MVERCCLFSHCVFFLVFLAAAGSPAPSWAGDWCFYGITALRTYWYNTDPGNGDGRTITYDQFLETVKLGAKYKHGAVKARFELGEKGDMRRLWGEFKVGKTRLRVGKEYTPVHMSDCLEEYGGLDGGRRSMVQLQIKGVKVAAVEPRLKKFGVSGSSKETCLPKLEISYNFQNNALGGKLAGGFQHYCLKTAARKMDIESWVMGAGLDIRIGQFFLAGTVHVSQNSGPYGLDSATDGNPVITNCTVYDNKGLGGALVARYLSSDSLTIETGLGFKENRVETAADRDDAWSFYLLVRYSPTPGITIKPEIGIQDHGRDLSGESESRILYSGIEWELCF